MISIVIPVYNVEKYLDDCLDSIQRQTFKDWECILVDDGSKDGSGAICDAWSNRDARFRVIHQPNGGVSKARNAGIEAVKGEYVTFIDSDDWVDAEYLRLFNANNKYDLVVTGVKYEYGNAASDVKKPKSHTVFKIDQQGLKIFVSLNRLFLLYAPYSKLYKTSILKNHSLRFLEDCSYGEDLQFNYGYLEYVKDICQIDEAHYHYRILGSGTLSSKKRQNQFQQDYEQWQLLRSFYERHGLWLKEAKEMLYERLWGIVYDGLFSTSTDNKQILSIPEIEEMKDFQDVFDCSGWIKYGVIHRMPVFFSIYRLFSKK